MEILNDEIIRQKIRERAFEIWEWRVENDRPGSALEDWLEAEGEVLEQYYKERKYGRT